MSSLSILHGDIIEVKLLVNTNSSTNIILEPITVKLATAESVCDDVKSSK